jgi:hypothetical protein
MKRLLSVIALMAFGQMLSVGVAAAQSKTIPGETRTVSGTVEAIDVSGRTILLNTGKEYEELDVPPEVKNFPANVKVGDKLNLRYYDNVVLILKKPGDPDVNKATGGAVVTPGVPGRTGTVARQMTATVTITAIDQKVPSITFTGPNNRTFSSRVSDPKALAQVKVGDRVEITWTAAVVATLEPAK